MSGTQNEYFQEALGNKPNWIKIGMRTYNQNLRAMKCWKSNSEIHYIILQISTSYYVSTVKQ